MWSLTSLRTKRISRFRKFRLLPPKDFFDSIDPQPTSLLCAAKRETNFMRAVLPQRTMARRAKGSISRTSSLSSSSAKISLSSSSFWFSVANSNRLNWWMVEPWHRSCPHGLAGDFEGPVRKPAPLSIIFRSAALCVSGRLSWRPFSFDIRSRQRLRLTIFRVSGRRRDCCLILIDQPGRCRNRLSLSSAWFAPLNRGSLNSAHIHGTDVPVEEPSTASNSDVVASITSFSVAGCCARAANRTTGPVSLKTPRDFERPSPWPDRRRRASSRPYGDVLDNRGNIRDTRVSTRLELRPACLRRCHQPPSTRLDRQG